eukprot:CAMPEP_0167774094 /NCGR_PEP_ID=MMETSP0111_2-20121227/1803_1 /TAXON_ID=91324 /ORGANISM="Lotharella globosa, Strain CCCM811" /LENGTH=149 /DNA_ID=CAMNT_0007663841 /DNA_START=93 /DNA_END=543 /DNA_ORIENTATION=+
MAATRLLRIHPPPHFYMSLSATGSILFVGIVRVLRLGRRSVLTLLMPYKIPPGREGGFAGLALERSLACVHPHMDREVAAMIENLATELAGELGSAYLSLPPALAATRRRWRHLATGDPKILLWTDDGIDARHVSATPPSSSYRTGWET